MCTMQPLRGLPLLFATAAVRRLGQARRMNGCPRSTARLGGHAVNPAPLRSGSAADRPTPP